MKQERTLYVFPKFFPYTRYEVFVENEIRVLSLHFNRVVIFTRTKDEFVRDVPQNCEIMDDFTDASNLKGYKLSLQDWFSVVSIHIAHLFESKFFKRLFNSKADFFFLVQKYKEYKKLKVLLASEDLSHATFYSVWLNDWATVLSIARKKGDISNLYTRAHGFDMYHYRYDKGYVPYRKLTIQQATTVSCVSEAGKKYLTEQFSGYQHKFRVSHLGVFGYGINPFESDKLLFVTVSNSNAVKRVHLLVEALSLVTIPAQWIHFGDGPLQNDLIDSAKKLGPNIKVEFKGRVSSKELMNFYSTTPVSVLILLSESEGGVPVAIQEATSFGIPFIATEVGGVPEIYNGKNGILLPKNFPVGQLAEVLSSFQFNRLNTLETRESVKKDWLLRFNAEINFGKFAQHMISHD